MTANERAWHDWLDQELDSLTGSTSVDDSLIRTASELQRLDNEQQPQPDELFLQRLEQHLMPTHSSLAAAARPAGSNLRNRLAARRPYVRSRHTQRLVSVFSILLLIAMIGATSIIALRGGRSDDPNNESPWSALVTAPMATPSPLASASLAESWRLAPLNDGSYAGAMTVANGVVYRSLPSSETEGTIQALDARDGHVIWRQSGHSVGFQIVADNLGVYAAVQENGDDQEIVAMDAESGGRRWTLSLGTVVVTMSLHAPGNPGESSTLVIKDYENNVWAIDAASGSVHWKKSIAPQEAPVDINLIQITTDGRVVIAQTTFGAIAGLDFTTGAILWKLPRIPVGALLISGTTVVILQTGNPQLSEQELTGVKVSDGSVQWSRTVFGFSAAAWKGLAQWGGSVAIVARNLGAVTYGETSTPVANSDPSFLATSHLGPSVPSTPSAYVVNPETGGTLWMTDETSLFTGRPVGTDPSVDTSVFGLDTVTASNGDQILIAMTFDGQIGTLGPVAIQRTPLPTFRFQGQTIASPIFMKYDFRSLETDGGMVFIQLGDGVLIAYKVP